MTVTDTRTDDKLQRLASLSQEMLAKRRLIIASNRGPLEYRI